MIAQYLLDLLVCPVCKVVFEVKADGTGLKCNQCHRLYPVRDNIPILLVDEATIENS
jgi:uncharacterized protein YbaR (Trm112 family)